MENTASKNLAHKLRRWGDGAREGEASFGLSLANLQDDSAIQLVLPFDLRRAMALDAALDSVRERYGTDAITRAVLVGRDQGVSMPLLPD